MKKLILLVSGILMVCAVSAQVLEEGESALIYYSPKTAISLDFEYTVETYEAGIYAEYAEAMLGTTEAVTENKKVYTLKDVHIGTQTTTDYSRPHKVAATAGFPVLLNINDKGILTGYNVPMPEKAKPVKPHEPSHKQGKHNAAKEQLPPFTEDVLKAATPEAQAYEVAKQIFHLRETRMYLINGEVEHAPADGQAMKLVLEELDQQEKALTELFLGKKSKHKKHNTVHFTPSDEGELLFFSEENGFTDGDNIDADTVEVRMICQQQIAQPVLDPKKKKGVELSQIVYNVPGYCAVNVFYKGQNMASRAIPVAQLGIDIALPVSMFTGKELPKIIFSEKTGNIISISK